MSRRRAPALGLAGLVTLLAGAGCSGGSFRPAGAVALHDLHQVGPLPRKPNLVQDFYALPFPNDVRTDHGTVDLSLYPRQDGLPGMYVDAIDHNQRGFGTNAAVFFRFSDAVDPTSLPQTANDSIAPTATAFLVDVTKGSPTYGQRTPVLAQFTADGGQFIGPNWLALLPFPGVPLRQKTTYAAVLTAGLRASDGAPIRTAVDFDAVRTATPEVSDVHLAAGAVAYAPLFAWLTEHPEITPVNATVFTTGDVTSIMGVLRQAVYDQAPAPVLADLADGGDDLANVDHIYTGTYQSPNFQAGAPPYQMSGGQLVFNGQGIPQVQRTETLRVAMTVPLGTMPPNGWPVVLYAHGTGGDYKSFIDDRSGREAAQVKDANGNVMAQMAMISIDQVLHGTRVPAGTDVEIAFFNLFNIDAARANVKQGALDDFQLMRLVKTLDVTAPNNVRIKFDPTKIYFKGHSQGGLTGPLFLAAEPDVKAAILSGAGAGLIQSLLYKTQPVDIPTAVANFLGEPVDQFHPLLSLVQGYFEDSDPVNYGPLLFKAPPQGLQPKSIFQSLGIVDHYAPIPTIEVLALSMGVQPVRPDLQEIPGLDLAGLAWTDVPQLGVVGNVAGGQATGVLLEYKQAGTSDGHFVIFDVPAAIAQSNRFLASHVQSGKALLLAP